MRSELKKFRVGENLTQDEMANKIGCSRACYQSIERGKRNGSLPFVQKLKKAFDLSNDEVMELMKNEGKTKSDSPIN